MSSSSVAFIARAGDLTGRLDPAYVHQHVAAVRGGHWGARKLGEMATRVQYGSSDLATVEPVGVQMLRMNNLQDDGWDLTDLKYADFDDVTKDRYLLEHGDILINRTNGTKELVGKSQVFDLQGDWVFASYLIRVRVDKTQVLPEFVVAFLNSDLGRARVTARSRQILQTNVSARELRELEIPVPPLEVQAALVAELRQAMAERDRQNGEAEHLLASIGQIFMALSEVPLPPTEQPSSFALAVRELEGQRIDATAHRPIYGSGAREVHTVALNALAQIDPPREKPTGETVAYAGLPQCSNLDVQEVVMRPLGEVQNRKVFRSGDLLFARIEPSVFNMKYPWARAPFLAGHSAIYTSTEFYVVDPEDGVDPSFLFAAFRSAFVQAQVRGRTTGSSGRRRLEKSLFEELAIPVVAPAVARQIAVRTLEALEGAEELRRTALTSWAAAKAKFEAALTDGEPA